MTLLELRDYVRQQKKASLQDISQAFHTEQGVIEGMMDVWVQKGKVRLHRAENSGKCGGCCSCDKGIGQYYEWAGQ